MFVCPDLVSDWFVSVLLYYIGHWVPGPTEIETLLKFLGWNLISVAFIKQSM
jgi:hypothetical protein